LIKLVLQVHLRLLIVAADILAQHLEAPDVFPQLVSSGLIDHLIIYKPGHLVLMDT